MAVTIYLAGASGRAGLVAPGPARQVPGPAAEALRSSSFLAEAPDEIIEIACELAVPVAAFAGDWIVSKSQPAEGLYLLSAGSVELYTEKGEYLVTLSDRGTFSEDALFYPVSGIGGARARTACNLWLLGRGTIEELSARHAPTESFLSAYRHKQSIPLLWI